MNIVIAPDSFKGTLSAPEAASVISRAFSAAIPGLSAVSLPIADGGEGTLDCFAGAGGKLVPVATVDGYGQPLTAAYCLLQDGSAVCEAASVVPYSSTGRRDPSVCSTFGLGAIVRAAFENSCASVAVGIGGTGSNDGGAGFAAAMGVRFFRADGREFIPCGATLSEIADYDVSAALRLLDGRELSAMCDVDNPFSGECGAARIFAPQKGADPEMVEMLDAGLSAFENLIRSKSGVDLRDLPGAGAAGGLGGGMYALLGGRLKPGIDTVLSLLRFPRFVSQADLVVTGEGCIDEQTLMGKAVAGVLKASGRVPVIAIGGFAKPGAAALYDAGISAVCACNRTRADFEATRRNASAALYSEAFAAAKLLSLGSKLK